MKVLKHSCITEDLLCQVGRSHYRFLLKM